MIDFQSPWTGMAEPSVINQKSAAGMSSPGGEETGEGEPNHRERGERHFLCCSFVGEPNHHGPQSAPNCLSGFRVSACDETILPKTLWLGASVAKITNTAQGYQAYPRLRPILSQGYPRLPPVFPSPPKAVTNVFQGYPSPPKAIQGNFKKKKIVYFYMCMIRQLKNPL
jgi:hypothetical protein